MIKIIEDAINKFKSARKGEEVRNALVDVAEFAYDYSMKAITFGTEISENETVATSDYFDGMGYLNTQTGDLFKVEDGKWIKKGNLSGKDGESITGTSEIVEGGVKVTLYDKNTEEVIDTFILFNGQNGQDGQNGASLTVEHSKSGLVTTVTIKNAETGSVIDTFEINDGQSGSGTGDMLESDFVGESATKSVHKADSASSADSVEWNSVQNRPTKTSDFENDSHFVSDEKYKHIDVDSELSKNSENPVQNKVIAEKIEKKIDKPASATNGQVLTYNGTSNEWEAQDSKGGAGKQVKPCEYAIERWLRFDTSNKKGLIIKAGTSIRNSQGKYIDFDSDTSVDLTSVITTAGEDYYVYMLDDGSITASLTSATAPSNSVRIGRFHSLCVAVGTCTMIVPPSSIAVGSNYLVKNYRQDEDLDFFNLYNKSVTATGTNNETLAHPLSGFEAGAILPESVMCLSFHSGSLFDDGQVYDKDIDAFIDIYLQSGIGLNTRSKYGATHTVLRTQCDHMVDMRQVGKKLLSDGEFESASIGSNQATNITGSKDQTTVGGHVDTANRRMISAIGAEEMCGYLWQWTRDVSSTGGSSWETTDGNGSFGQEVGTPYVLRAGGDWDNGSTCGSRSRDSNGVRSLVGEAIGGRGLSRVVRGV